MKLLLLVFIVAALLILSHLSDAESLPEENGADASP